jgi:uncharacterized protein YxeA
MTKILNTIIIIVMIALIATFVVTAISLQNKTNQVLTQYSARREELATRQQQIQDMIVSLNSTLQAETIKQQEIAAQLGVQINTTAITPLVTVPTTPVASTPTPQAPVIPQPRPRVTRAS